MTLYLDPETGEVLFPDGTVYTTISTNYATVTETVKNEMMQTIISDYSEGNTQVAGEAHARFTREKWILGRPEGV